MVETSLVATEASLASAGARARLPDAERIVACGLGASFHVLATPALAGVELRLSLADLFLGLLALLVARILAESRFALPRGLRRGYAWSGAMFALLAFAYLRVGVHTDPAATWAQLKLLGFGVLTAYFVAASLFAYRRGEAAAVAVIQGFVAGAWVSGALGLIEYGAYYYFDQPIAWAPRAAALAENPNSFGIMLAVAVALSLGATATRPLFGPGVTAFGTAVVLVAILLSASRTAYASLAAGLLALTLLGELRVKTLLRHVAAGTVLFLLLFTAPPWLVVAYDASRDVIASWMPGSVAGGPRVARPRRVSPAPKQTYAIAREQVDLGVEVRIDLAREAGRMWWEHPWLGAGLGAFWRAQRARGVAFPYVNHSTLAWFASETGLAGVVLFLVGVLGAAAAFLKARRRIILAGALLGMLCTLLVASLGAEVTYQRYAWCFCGLGLGLLARGSTSPEKV